MAIPVQDTRPGNVPRGILYMIAATVMFAATGAITKWELALYPPGEVAFLRQLSAFVFCSVMILPRSGLAVLRTERLGQHLTRGVSQFTSQMCLIGALCFMPLGSAMSISFSAPLFAVLFSVLFFGERVGVHRAAALVFGLVGVLLVTEPRGASLDIGALLALGNATIYASVTVAVRRMSATESPETLTIYQMIILTVLMAMLLPFGFTTPAPVDAALLMACGIANGIGQFWWTRALSLAPSSAIMPFYYLSLVWAIGVGFLVWGDIPSHALIAGAAVVIASGLYLIWRESIARKRALEAARQIALCAADPATQIDLHQDRHIQFREYMTPSDPVTTGESRTMDTLSPQVGSPQVGSPQVGSPQAGSPQVGSPQVGSPQVGSPQVGSPQVGSPQVGSPQVGSPQVGSPQVGSPQVGSPQAGVPQAEGTPGAPVLANPAPPVKHAGAFNEERVLEVQHWTDRLFSFRTTRTPSFRFESGQFAMIGLVAEGRPLLRAYSMTSASHDEHLEFYSIKVLDGPLTSRLQHIRVGDTVLVGRKPTGTLITGNLRPGRRLFLLATGTGIAPFLSLIKDPEIYERFESVVLAHGCRHAADLDYGIKTVLDVRGHEVLGEMASRQLLYYATVTRDAYHHRGRITDALATGHLVQHLSLPSLDRASDRVMLCGSTTMLADVAAWLQGRGFVEGSGAEPGDYVIEKAFVER